MNKVGERMNNFTTETDYTKITQNEILKGEISEIKNCADIM